ncbi:MAG: ATP-binding cassette domain-containing protein [Gemmatimonadota bacterium]
MLRARLASRRGEFSLAAELTAAAGTTLVLVGPNGSGKSTVLRMLAGLERPETGEVRLDAETWGDTTRGLWLPAEERSVGWLPQELALFPHLSALENVAFGLRARGDRAAGARAREALRSLGLERELDPRPAALSGGERQRVALARALVVEPRLLLLDEPLSAIDPSARASLRALLRRALAERGVTTVYVTHSPMEALALGARLAVMHEGTVVQEGMPGELLHRPRSEAAGAFIGTNFFRGTIGPAAGAGLVSIRMASGSLLVPDSGLAGEVFVAIDPREIVISRELPSGSARNVFRGRVTEIAPEPPRGERVRIALATEPPLVAEVTRQALDALGVAEGTEVYAAFKATALAPYQ